MTFKKHQQQRIPQVKYTAMNALTNATRITITCVYMLVFIGKHWQLIVLIIWWEVLVKFLSESIIWAGIVLYLLSYKCCYFVLTKTKQNHETVYIACIWFQLNHQGDWIGSMFDTIMCFDMKFYQSQQVIANQFWTKQIAFC